MSDSGILEALATQLAKVIKSKASLIPTEPLVRAEQESAAPTVMANAIDLSVDLDASVDESVDLIEPWFCRYQRN